MKLAQASGENEAVHKIGSIVLVKFFGTDGRLKTISKDLSTEEQLILATDQSILCKPEKFFELLELQTRNYVSQVVQELPPPAMDKDS